MQKVIVATDDTSNGEKCLNVTSQNLSKAFIDAIDHGRLDVVRELLKDEELDLNATDKNTVAVALFVSY